MRTQYESRRLFTELDKAQSEAARSSTPTASACRSKSARRPRRCASSSWRKRAAADAHRDAGHHAVRRAADARRRRSAPRSDADERSSRRRNACARRQRAAASTTPPARCWRARRRSWRSKFIVALVGARLRRAGRPRRLGAGVRQRRSSRSRARSATRRTLELPANRGRILDRNGLMLATSVPAPASGRFPKDIERDAAPSCAQLAKLLEMPPAELDKKLDDEDKNFVWLKRQVDEPVAQADRRRSTSRASTSARNTSASTRRAKRRRTSSASPTSRTAARKAWSSRSTRSWPAAPARAASSRTGSAASSRTSASRCRRSTASDLQLSIDSKVQFFAYQKLRDAVAGEQGQGRQRGRARRADRRGAGAGQLPELRRRTTARTSPASSCATAR